MDPLLSRLSDSLASARSLEDLTRPLLEMLEEVTRMESTYLTRIDFQQSLQHVLYARNSRQLEIPEGLAVPWGDTLCRRALQEGRFFTQDVPACWGDSEAAASLGIQTYVSVPVNLSDGVVFGTVCAASSKAAHLPQHAEKVLRLFAKLIAQQVEREQLLQALQQRNAQLTEMALVDSLTGVPNRRALYQELERLLAWARRSGRSVMVAYVDLDGFKQINDQHGHEAGDALLCAVARQLQAVRRESDYLFTLQLRDFLLKKAGLTMPVEFLKRWLYVINEGKFTKEEIEKDFDAFVKLFTWNYLQKYFIKQDNLTVTPEEATAEAKALAQAQFAQYGLPTAPEDMLANYAKKILEDREQGQKIYEKLYEMKVVEDVKSKIKVTEKAVSAEEFAKLAKEI